MAKPFPSKTHIGNHALHPETLMLNYGYDPQLSEGAVKPPVFLTSTFVFRTAEDGKDFFDFVAGRREPPEGMGAGLVYSRFNHPNSEIVEDRLAVYERTDNCALFSSGMAAISTTILAFTRPGDVILHSQPLYGGTETLLAKTLAGLSIGAVGFADGIDESAVRRAAEHAMRKGRVAICGLDIGGRIQPSAHLEAQKRKSVAFENFGPRVDSPGICDDQLPLLSLQKRSSDLARPDNEVP